MHQESKTTSLTLPSFTKRWDNNHTSTYKLLTRWRKCRKRVFCPIKATVKYLLTNGGTLPNSLLDAKRDVVWCHVVSKNRVGPITRLQTCNGVMLVRSEPAEISCWCSAGCSEAKAGAPLRLCKYRTRAELNPPYNAPRRAPKHDEIVPVKNS